MGDVAVEMSTFISMGTAGSQEGLIKQQFFTVSDNVGKVTVVASKDRDITECSHPQRYLRGAL